MKRKTTPYAIGTCVVLALLVAGLSVWQTGALSHLLIQATPTPSPVPIQQVVPTMQPTQRADLERGMAVPVWTKTGYSQENAAYAQALNSIYPQARATWISMQVSFPQQTDTSITFGASYPTLASFTEGVQAAKKAGYHIFFEPLITVTSGSDHWDGHIHPKNTQDAATWLQNWFYTLQPYLTAAQQAGVEQVAAGTELEWMQYHVSPPFWHQLLAEVHGVFQGRVIYDTNWDFDQNGQPLPTWFHDPLLGAIGVSTYIPLVSKSVALSASQADTLWKKNVQQRLDALSEALKKPVVLSEFGYRDTSDAGFMPYEYASKQPQNLQEQEILFNAALAAIIQDQHVLGVFLWGWSNAARFSLVGHPTLEVIARWYNV